MISVNGKYNIPDRWEELSSEQFIAIVRVLDTMGTHPFQEMKIMLLEALLDGKLPLRPDDDTYCSNMYRLVEHITFPYQFVYTDERFRNFSPSMQRHLKKYPPMDLNEPQIRLAARMKRHIAPDICFPAQLLPILPGSGLEGYTFSYTEGIAMTSLTAEQYIDANTILQEIHNTENTSLYPMLTQILYCPSPYASDKAARLRIGKPSKDILLAVMFNYMAVVNWISALDKYDILFHAPKKSTDKNPLGSGAALYALAGKGYGTLEQIGRLPLFQYLDLLLKQTVDAVRQLDGLKKTKPEIAKELNMTIDQINTII